MKKHNVLILFIILALFFSFKHGFSQQTRNIRVAVLEFKLIGTSPTAKIGEGIQEVVMTALSQNGLLEVVERARLEDIVRELSQGGSDLFNPNNAVKLGKLIQAKYVVTGSIIALDNSLRINARIISVETAGIYKSFSVVNPKTDNLFNTLENLSQEIEASLLGMNSRTVTENSPKIEIAFVIDSTGSMNDEIDVVKTRINAILNKTLNAYPRPVVRIAVVDYKDEDDDYVNRLFPFTEDITALKKHILSLQASGGGDYPEQIAVSVIKAINELDWSLRGASKMIFLIGDAPSHKSELLKQIITLANKKNIGIYTIACSGLDAGGVEFFKKLSANTNATFSYLSYRQEYVAETGERREVITQGRQVFSRTYRSQPANEGRISSAPPAQEAEVARQRNNWGADAAQGARSLSSREYREERPGAGSGINISRPERNRVIAPDAIRIQGFNRSGTMQNNLDDILIQNIRSQAARDLNIHYRTAANISTKFSALVTDDSGSRQWVFFSDINEFNKIKSAEGKIVLSASVHKTGENFILYNAQVNPRFIPLLGKRTLKAIADNIDFHIKNGITSEKRWFFTVKVLKIVRN